MDTRAVVDVKGEEKRGRGASELPEGVGEVFSQVSTANFLAPFLNSLGTMARGPAQCWGFLPLHCSF